ncbi:MAG: GHMP kinase [Flavobacteriaceae bacterium]|nr:MAG: GHMP kinase [Flavobacteriaceae bacterium]
MLERYYSHGKLLLTGEYVVLDGAKALALPTRFGQDLVIQKLKEPVLLWESYDHQGNCWLKATFELPKMRIVSADFESEEDGGKDRLAERLWEILQAARELNPTFLNSTQGYLVKTTLEFSQDWGLGSSSTLINNVAEWAQVSPFELLENTFGGSGYDIASAQNDAAIVYKRNGSNPLVEMVDFNPSFQENLYFVHLNVKQNSRAGIRRYQQYKEGALIQVFQEINAITKAMISVNKLEGFEKLLKEHEAIIGQVIKNKPVQELLFSDYFGQTKSLGAWGGDFIIATGNEKTPAYFKNKGFETVVSYKDMILKK